MYYKQNMRKKLLIIILFLYSNFLFAQISQIFFASYGMSILTDAHISGSSIHINGVDSTSYQHMQFNYFSVHFAGRMNLLHISENISLSLHVKPKVGFGVSYEVFDGGSWYNVGASVPLFFECNYGLASRSKSLKNNGYNKNIYHLNN